MRALDIIGEMCECRDQLLYMDKPDLAESTSKVLAAFDQRTALRAFLQKKAFALRSQLDEVAQVVNGGMF